MKTGETPTERESMEKQDSYWPVAITMTANKEDLSAYLLASHDTKVVYTGNRYILYNLTFRIIYHISFHTCIEPILVFFKNWNMD